MVFFLHLLATAAASSSGLIACHQRRPKRCGPVLSPGGFALNLLHQHTPPPQNLLFVNNSGRAALVCVPAKSGSTSFYFWLYHALAGTSWPYKGDPWVQDVASVRWANVSARAVRFSEMRHRERARALSDPTIRRFALVRAPLERGVSSFYSKIACGSGDMADHEGAIRQLMRQAPKVAAKLQQSGVVASSAGPSADGKGGGTPCLGAADWLRLLLEARGGERKAEVNPHFKTQTESCGFHHVGYHHLVPIEDNSYGMRQLAAHLGVTTERLGKNHVVSRSTKRALSSDAVELLARAFREDLALLQFPPVWPPSKNATADTARAALASAATSVMAAKGVGKAAGGKATGGKGAGGKVTGGKGAGGKGSGGKGGGKGVGKGSSKGMGKASGLNPVVSWLKG